MSTQDNGRAAVGDRVGDSVARLAQDTSELVRREVRAMQQEARTSVKRFGAGGVLLAGAATCGLLTLWAAHEALLRAAETVLPRRAAAAVLTGVYASGATALALAARGRIRAAAEAAADALEKEADTMEQRQEPAPAPADTTAPPEQDWPESYS